MAWYYNLNNQQIGPVDEDILQTKILTLVREL